MVMAAVVAATPPTASVAAASPAGGIASSLAALNFLNPPGNDTVHATDRFVWQSIPVQYLESQNVTRAPYAWADRP